MEAIPASIGLSTNLLSTIPEELRLRDYASPSVINAYFAELYQKKSPKEAMDYFLDLSRDLTYSQFSKALMNESHLSASTYQVNLMAWPYVNEEFTCVF